MKGLGIIVFVIATLSFTACTTMHSSTPSGPRSPISDGKKYSEPETPSGPRSIILDGNIYSETDVGKFVSWRCEDFFDGSGTLVEVGTFTDSELSRLGFILYDGGQSGESTSYGRKGINHRWDWGPNGGDYAFIIEPGGTGLFYDFSFASPGELVKANAVYKCHR